MHKLLSVWDIYLPLGYTTTEDNNSVYKHTENLSQKDLKETARVSIWTRPLVTDPEKIQGSKSAKTECILSSVTQLG